MDYRALGARIRHERQNMGLTQDRLAEKSEVSACYIGQIERGERKLSLETLIKIASVLGVSIENLLQTDTIKPNFEIEKLYSMLDGKNEKQIRMVIDVINLILRYTI